VVKAVAQKLSARLNKNVVVTAGIHWDHLDETAIREIEDNCALLADMIGDLAESEA
jgi:putative cell wall-binding protein